jgi:Na+/melibiose symporter-like transporter
LPAAAALIAMLIFIKYPLNDERFKQIRNETEARKLAAIKAHHKDAEAFITPDHAV